MRGKPAGRCGTRHGHGILLAWTLVFCMGGIGWSQEEALVNGASDDLGASQAHLSAAPDPLAQFEGLPVRSIAIQGVSTDRLVPLTSRLAQMKGSPLRRDDLKRSLRQLFATGLFETIDVEASPLQDGVTLVFHGTPRTFIGTVTVDGAKGANINTQLQRASQLTPGTRFTQARLTQALDEMRQTLAVNGFHEPVLTPTLTPHPEEQLMDIAFRIVSGPQARVGTVEVTGDPGMSAGDFRHRAHLRTGAHVDHETANRALTGVLKHYQRDQRLEAEIKVESQQYEPRTQKDNFHFSATRGPQVKVLVQGVSLSADRIKHVIPVFEEGTVDEDLLNEGNRRLRDYFQRLGYFDVKIDHVRQPASADQVVILYRVQLGPRRRVQQVAVAGNHYFDSATLKDLLNVHAADSFDRHGAYSQSLVTADIGALQTVYRNNGFLKVKITSEAVTDAAKVTPKGKPAPLTVLYHIEEGDQQRVGSVQIEGNDHVDAAKLTSQLNTAPGQLLSPQNLAGDRDALWTDYLSRGFDQAKVELTQEADPGDPNKVNVVFHITEGQQIFVRKVLLTGLHFTRPDTVAKAIVLHPGDPLNETALAETQRNLYEFALFSEIDTAVENPSGDEAYKTVLLQAVEARRWALTYGGGFEAQTGTPVNNCKGASQAGVPCNPNGKTGISPRVIANLTRNGLFGREQSASIQGTYGLIEQKINLLFQIPHLYGNRNFGFTFSGGYANSQDVTTYVASRLEAGARWTEHFNTPGSFLSKANTLDYEFSFRRVKVAASSLQVGITEIAPLSTATRVAGPGVTWIRDTRDSPLDAHRGTYTSFQEFLSGSRFGAQAEFNRIDVTNSSFYSFNKGRFVLARNTRYGQERAFGSADNELIPLPERLYAGGATSLRSFSINAAGPRDPETGYPVGGAGALANSTEMRLPPPNLPWLGDAVSIVIFHDMGNVFANAGDAWVSALRIHQPDRDTCKITATPSPTTPSNSTGPKTSCNFNYFSHTPGLGLRYHTPVGPIRLDFSYNLNPPIYPVSINYSQTTITDNPHVGQAPHFNFFFSLGQSF